jgi:hypothetical protein
MLEFPHGIVETSTARINQPKENPDIGLLSETPDYTRLKGAGETLPSEAYSFSIVKLLYSLLK